MTEAEGGLRGLRGAEGGEESGNISENQGLNGSSDGLYGMYICI